MTKTAPMRTLIGLAALSCPVAAGAATSTTTFVVQAQITAACTISATSLNFGTLSSFTGNTDVTSTVNAVCTNTTPYDIAMDKGSAAGSSIESRLLANGTATLSYQLYRDATHNPDPGARTIGAPIPRPASGTEARRATRSMAASPPRP